ncbi:MAG: GIY-YIG nuclease family protein [Candidatus Omnitrophica bacterium]|nr:GIY-YIG nuclease family protein [Candidatus Omnitrophota bacterium]
MWKVYILETNHGTLYTGITNNLEKRVAAHKKGKGALFTRLCGVKKLLYSENRRNRSFALKREAEIKKWPRKKKLELIKGAKNAVSQSRRTTHQCRYKKSPR